MKFYGEEIVFLRGVASHTEPAARGKVGFGKANASNARVNAATRRPPELG
jgi:hypothetical protein